MVEINQKSYENTLKVRNITKFERESDGVSPSCMYFDFITIESGDHKIPLCGTVTTLGGPGAEEFIATPQTKFAWISDFDISQGDRLNVNAFNFTNVEDVREKASEWTKGGADNPAVELNLAPDIQIVIEGMSLEYFTVNLNTIVDLTPPHWM
ncbi:hypothetical protein [Chelatococcus asaccharovorans]|uniref:hypothetical protein n=1 Tax=Chelatococcus asaccharovorans TaxID=28210 RepID=UPI00224C791F|nr:hypothetical protein [Chelatococcus asaccharovorans]CAH1669016.1 Transcription termination protein NusA [Chelatococcus asaccharovorans]CAH1679536.1 Transcription termination protein NusA [Chelatococcus asaccharovorans]